MAKNTPSMAKNQMRRCLRAIVDPHPTGEEVSELWTYFQSACAYCGLSLTRGARDGHVDHVVPHSSGGSNSIYNHVLSCSRCNGDEKREEDWESFLARKALVPLQLAQRHTHIATWLERATGLTRAPSVSSEDVEAIIKSALESFDASVKQLCALPQAGAYLAVERPGVVFGLPALKLIGLQRVQGP